MVLGKTPFDVAVIEQSAVVDQAHPIADRLYRWCRVRDKDNRSSGSRKLLHRLHALLLKVLIADREDLVQQQDVGIQIRCNREAEPHLHAGRVVLERHVHEVIETRVAHDPIVNRFDVRPGEAMDGGVEEHVLGAVELLVESTPSSMSVPIRAALATSSRPLVGRCKPAISFRNVLFPDPLRPTIPTASPCPMRSDTFLSAQNSSNTSRCSRCSSPRKRTLSEAARLWRRMNRFERARASMAAWSTVQICSEKSSSFASMIAAPRMKAVAA